MFLHGGEKKNALLRLWEQQLSVASAVGGRGRGGRPSLRRHSDRLTASSRSVGAPIVDTLDHSDIDDDIQNESERIRLSIDEQLEERNQNSSTHKSPPFRGNTSAMGPASSTEGAPSSNALSDGDISRLAMSIAQAVGDMVNRKPKEANHDSMGTTDRPEIHNSSSHRIASAVGTLSTRDVIAEPRSGAVGPGSSFSVPGACAAGTSRINNNNEQLFDRRNTNFAQIGDSSSRLEPNPLLSQQERHSSGKDINLASPLIPEHKEATPREMSIGDETFTIKDGQNNIVHG